MAEFVELRTEEMLPELEQMERILLFEKDEIRTIAKKRKDFEYKIQRRTKNKEDYLRYIQYEMDLLKLIKLRREKMGFQQKKANIDFTIGNRVNKLFKQAIFRFQDDVRLWLSYIKFCKQVRMYSCVSRMLVRMLQVHSDKPQLWKLAAKWEFEESQSVENARQFLLRGLRFHPDSRLLYAEAFRMELHYAAKKRAEREEQEPTKKGSESEGTGAGTSADDTNASDVSKSAGGGLNFGNVVPDKVAEGRLAEVIYESALKKVNDVTFIIQLLDIAKEFSFTVQLQRKIVDELLLKFPDEELTWDTMARRELEGLSYTASGSSDGQLPVLLGVSLGQADDSVFGDDSDMMEVDGETPSGSSTGKNTALMKRLRMCCEVYEAVVKKISTERMWSLYLDTLLETNQDQTQLPVFKKKLLKRALQGAHDAGKLQEKYYLHWYEMLQSAGKVKKVREVLRCATERLPNSPELWQMRLRFHLSRDEEALGEEVFNRAVQALGNDIEAVLPLWKIQLQYCQTKSPAKTEGVFEKGLNAPNIAVALRPLYLEWLALSRGIRDARAAYDKLCLQPPLCLELHTKMAALESIQTTAVLKQVRKCHENACTQFGKENSDVWMDYVKFELKRGDPKNVSSIYWRAVRQLVPIQADIFISEFSLVKSAMSSPQAAETLCKSHSALVQTLFPSLTYR